MQLNHVPPKLLHQLIICPLMPPLANSSSFPFNTNIGLWVQCFKDLIIETAKVAPEINKINCLSFQLWQVKIYKYLSPSCQMVVSDVIIFLVYQLWDPADPNNVDVKYKGHFTEFWDKYDNIVNKYVFPTPIDPLPFSRCNCEDPLNIISIHSLMSQEELPMDHLLMLLAIQHKYLYSVQNSLQLEQIYLVKSIISLAIHLFLAIFSQNLPLMNKICSVLVDLIWSFLATLEFNNHIHKCVSGVCFTDVGIDKTR